MANKAIFFDRDDTLIEDPGYINNPDQVKLLDGVSEALIELRGMDYKLVIVSNQSGVARGILTEEVLGQIHKRLEQLLGEKGASVDRIYYCPYHPDGVIPKYRRASEMRKPGEGMLLEAAKDMDIDLKESWMVGNGVSDVEAGSRAGCRTILLDSRGHEQKIQPGQIAPDYRAVNLKEVVNIIKMHQRGRKPAAAAPANEQVIQPQKQPEHESTKQLALEKTEKLNPMEKPEYRPDKGASANELLQSILDQLKQTRRTSAFGEFYMSRFIAWFIQMLVLGCLLASISFLMSPTNRLNAILVSLGFAIVLQVMALTFFIMQGPK